VWALDERHDDVRPARFQALTAVGNSARTAGAFAAATGGNGRWRKLPGIAVSLLIVGAFVGAGWQVMPRGEPTGGVMFYQAPAERLHLSVTGTMPVFVMRQDQSAIRHGVARVQPDGLIRVDLYDEALPEFATTSEALLFQPGFAALWAAASEASQKELLKRAEAVQGQVGRTLEQVMGSEVFNREYRPALRAILTDAVTAAWDGDRSKVAFDSLLATADPMLRDMLRDEAGKIMEVRLERAFWEFIKTNWASPLYVITGDQIDYTPLSEAIQGVLQDPRLSDALLRLGNQVLDTHESRIFAERLAIGIIDALLRDHRVPDVAARLFWDARFRDEVQPLYEALVALGGALPRHLGGLGNENSLNPLAAHVFKAMTLNSATSLIVFVTPDRRDRIERADPDAAVRLVPVARG
jgi:hypothetical protein